MPKKEKKGFFSLNSSSPAKVSLKRIAQNVPGNLQENADECLIFYKSCNSVNGVLRKIKFAV